MGSCFVGRWVVANKISIMLHCWSNVVWVNSFVIPLGSIVIKENYLCTNGCHWCTVIIKDPMDLVICWDQWIDTGRPYKVDNDVNLGQNEIPVFCWKRWIHSGSCRKEVGSIGLNCPLSRVILMVTWCYQLDVNILSLWSQSNLDASLSNLKSSGLNPFDVSSSNIVLNASRYTSAFLELTGTPLM